MGGRGGGGRTQEERSAGKGMRRRAKERRGENGRGGEESFSVFHRGRGAELKCYVINIQSCFNLE